MLDTFGYSPSSVSLYDTWLHIPVQAALRQWNILSRRSSASRDIYWQKEMEHEYRRAAAAAAASDDIGIRGRNMFCRGPRAVIWRCQILLVMGYFSRSAPLTPALNLAELMSNPSISFLQITTNYVSIFPIVPYMLVAHETGRVSGLSRVSKDYTSII